MQQKFDISDLLALGRRFSTAMMLFHQGVAERAGLGASDHKCLALLRETGAMTGSELAAVTGLTTGAITGVVARLENRGLITREADPHDARKQILRPALGRIEEKLHVDLAGVTNDIAALMRSLDAHQRAGLARFLDHGAAIAMHHAKLARSPVSFPIRLAPESVDVE